MSNENNKRIAKNTMFLYFRMILVLFVSIYTTRVVLNALGVVDYGINNVVAGFVSMFTFLNTSMANGIQRFYNFTLGKKTEGNIRSVYNTAFQIQAALAIIIFILLETVGLWYMYKEMQIPAERINTALWVFQFAVASTILLIMQAPYASAIMAYERMNYYAYVGIFDVLLKLLIAYMLTKSNSDRLLLYGFLHLITSLIHFLMYYVYAKTQFKDLKFEFALHKELFKPMLSFSGWNIFGSFAYMLKGQGLNLLLNSFFGVVINSARGVSNMIMSALQGFQSNVIIAFRPQIIKSYAAGNFQYVKTLFYSLSKISFLMLTILSAPIILELDYILKIWLGNTIPEYTKSFTVLILFNMVISSLTTPLSQIVHATGKMKTYQMCTSIILCSIVPISWVFLKFGCDPNSVYYTSLGITILNQIICNIIVKKNFPYSIKEYIKKVIIPCTAFIITVLAIPYVITCSMEESVIRLALTSIAVIFTAILVAYFMVLDKDEQKLLRKFVKKE